MAKTSRSRAAHPVCSVSETAFLSAKACIKSSPVSTCCAGTPAVCLPSPRTAVRHLSVQAVKRAWQIAATKPFASHFRVSKNSSMPVMSASDWTSTAAADALHLSALSKILLVIQGECFSAAPPRLVCSCSQVLHEHPRRDWLLQLGVHASRACPHRDRYKVVKVMFICSAMCAQGCDLDQCGCAPDN